MNAIVLVRHGETAGNAKRQLQFPDTALSPRGVEQARRVAQRLTSHRIGALLSSDYARAHSTAEAIAAASGASIEVETGLRERDFGALRGRAYADLGFDPFVPDYTPPGGESWQALHDRVDRVWSELQQRAAGLDGDLVVVTHGLVCWSLASRHFDLGGEELTPGRIGNTSVTLLDAAPPFSLRLFACSAHLDDMAAADGIPG